ncbi:MAG: methyltransferase domain-containing protein [Patescibacteria group bacterium]
MKPQLKTSFGRFAKEYQKYRRSYDPKLYELLFSLLPKIQPNQKVAILDIGSGTGKSTEPLLQTGRENLAVIGLDPDDRMLDEARLSAQKQKLPIVYLKGKAENLPFEKGTFDSAISGAAFHWYGNKKTVTGVRKILKKAGVFFIFWAQFIDTDKPTIGEEIYVKYKWKTISQKFRKPEFIKHLLSQGGFERIQIVKIPFTEKKTPAYIIGNLKTNSSYSLLSPKQQKDFVREMTKAYKTALGGKKFVTDKLELLVCYAFN